MSECEQRPAKRKRLHRNKKWMEREILQIIDYLQEEPEVEQPTAQIYYRRFLEKTNLDATWELVRWKVRHLKHLYNKANQWLQQQHDQYIISSGTLAIGEDNILIKEKLVKMCPHFRRLRKIFGQPSQDYQEIEDETFVIEEHMEPPASDIETGEYKFVPCDAPASDVQANDESTYSYNNSEPLFNAQEQSKVTSPNTFDSRKRLHHMNQHTTIQWKRLQLDQQKFEREKEIEERRLAIEEKKLQIDLEKAEYEKKKNEKDKELDERKVAIEEKRLELDLKKVEVDAKIRESEVELKKLELEMNERIAKYEIERKYKE